MGDGPIDVCGPNIVGCSHPNLIATALTDLEVGGEGSVSLSEACANARLIAAAPEMYEALRDLREACTEAYKAGRIEAEPFIRAGNALDKAEGK